MRMGAALVLGYAIFCILPAVHADGVLGEYFAPLATSCSSTNGSLTALHGRLPSISRKDSVINFPSRTTFALSRCAWERINGAMVYNCRGSNEFSKYFAARWSGDLLVFLPGLYTFEIEADDGARLTMGYGRCPGILCGDKTAVMNARASELRQTTIGPHSSGKDCLQCGQGIYIDCFVTSEGCEPFSVWRLEADGGASSSSCGSPATTINGTRYLHGGTHPFELEYFQRGDAAKMILRYSGPDTGGAMIPVPSSNLFFPSGNTLRAEWFSLPSEPSPEQLPAANLLGAVPAGAQLVLREDDTFDTNGPGVAAFSTRVADFDGPLLIRWTGYLFLNSGGEYNFRLESDDGSRVVIGARGAGGERVLVDNDGLHAGVQSATVTADMLPGLHPIRIEYFHVPGQGFGVPRPPGVQIFFNGQDTQMREQLITRDRLILHDGSCQLNANAWSVGMYMARDCGGRCFDGQQRAVGDKVCDDGSATFLGEKLLLTCPAYDNDNNDCNEEPAPPEQAVRPEYRCHVSCPTGNFHRRDCSACKSEVQASNRYGSFCSQSSSGNLTFTRCCSAKLYGLEYWDQDCIAFGSTTRCNETLLEVLDSIRRVEPRLDWLAARPDGAVANPIADLMVDCEGDYCNFVTPAFVLNPFTLQPTETRICPIQESSSNGTECFVGPWEVTYLADPYTECQQGRYQWNFCRDRKSVDGRPFVKCCSFAYLNALGQGECRFTGITEGTCARYMEMLRRKNQGNSFFSISNPQTLQECTGNLCNDPMDSSVGCPNQVIENHRFTIRDRLVAGPAWQNLLVGAPSSDINWPLIIIPVCGVLFLCVAAVIYRRSLRTTPESPWHSQAAKVVGKTTFVEPERDLGGLEGTYGVVKPRPLALRQIMDADKIKPQALRIDPIDANPLVAAQAEAVEGSVPMAASSPSPSPLQQAAQGDISSPSPMRALLENEEMQQEVQVEIPMLPADVQTLALQDASQVRALETDMVAALPSPYATALVLQATPTGMQQQLEQVFLPPDALLPVATMAATQSSLPSTPGATPTIAPQIPGARGRPAAAARLQRQGVGGVPRVAT